MDPWYLGLKSFSSYFQSLDILGVVFLRAKVSNAAVGKKFTLVDEILDVY